MIQFNLHMSMTSRIELSQELSGGECENAYFSIFDLFSEVRSHPCSSSIGAFTYPEAFLI